VKHTEAILKQKLAELMEFTGFPWLEDLPLVLLAIDSNLHGKHELTL
jgi:hypothetical protein